MSGDTTSTPWHFQDPPNVAVITSADILDRGEWIHSVFLDEGDGYWQFHSRHGAPDDDSEVRICSLQHIVNKDPSVAELAELPHGVTDRPIGSTRDRVKGSTLFGPGA